MNRGKKLVLGIAIIAAILAALLAKGMIRKPETKVVEREIAESHILVAARTIKLGDAVNPGHFKWQPWPRNAATGYINKKSKPDAPKDFAGSIASVRINQGDPIIPEKLVKPGEGGVMAAILPQGKRAISTPIRDPSNGVSGLILPNDRVDVIVTMRLKGRDGRNEQVVSETVMKNIRVLAIGQNFETKDDEKVANGKSATLELTPREAETLALAQSKGEIWLSLRSIADIQPRPEERNSKPKWGEQTGGNIKILRYGVPSQQFGVN